VRAVQVGFGQNERKELHTCGDLEGHLADGSFYVLDFARLFPPEAPPYRPSPGEKRAFLYRMLRPELVLSNAVPLSSDCFTLWGSADPNFKVPTVDRSL
jgi:hypothetical protein